MGAHRPLARVEGAFSRASPRCRRAGASVQSISRVATPRRSDRNRPRSIARRRATRPPSCARGRPRGALAQGTAVARWRASRRPGAVRWSAEQATAGRVPAGVRDDLRAQRASPRGGSPGDAASMGREPAWMRPPLRGPTTITRQRGSSARSRPDRAPVTLPNQAETAASPPARSRAPSARDRRACPPGTGCPRCGCAGRCALPSRPDRRSPRSPSPAAPP